MRQATLCLSAAELLEADSAEHFVPWQEKRAKQVCWLLGFRILRLWLRALGI